MFDNETPQPPQGFGRRGPRGRGFGRGFGRHGGPGPGGHEGRFGPGGPGPKGRRRGDIRYALLSTLADGPGHGYDLIQRLEQRTGGRWRPSPGSVYPTLQMLEEAGLVRGEDVDGKRVFTITEAGQADLAERIGKFGAPPWMDPQNADGRDTLRQAVMQIGLAVKLVGTTGNAEVVTKAAAILEDARRKLHQLIADI